MSFYVCVVTGPVDWYVREQTQTTRQFEWPRWFSKIEDMLQRGVNVERGRELARIESQLFHFVGMILLEAVRHFDTKKWQSLKFVTFNFKS